MSEGVYWVDANVLLRFLTGEPPELAERAERILERGEEGELTLRVHPVIVAETVWVLRSFYKRTAEEIAGALVPLFSGHRLRVEDGRVIVAALEAMAREGVDFADALLAEKAQSQEEGVASFDRDFERLGVSLYEKRDGEDKHIR